MSALSRHMILGVDPGLSGALAIYDPVAKLLVGVYDMPTRPTRNGKKNELNIFDLSFIVEVYAPRIRLAVVEEVSARPGNGVTGMFRFGYSLGAVVGILGMAGIPTFFTKPQVWKTLTGLSHDKNLSRSRACQLFPERATEFKRVKDDGRAEAALLAVFGERLL
jgi:crossover junction endodeoxyribonuclease RuvC